MELEMWPFEAEEKRALRRMADGKRTVLVWYHSCIWVEIGGSAGAEKQENPQHITSPQVSFKAENSWYEVNLMVSWII